MVTDRVAKKAEVVREGTYGDGQARHGTAPEQSHRTRTTYLDKAALQYRQALRGDQTPRESGDDSTQYKG